LILAPQGLHFPWSYAEKYISQLQAPNIDAIVIPKVNSASDLHFITDVVRHALPHRHPSSTSDSASSPPPIRLLALIESARSLTNLSEICKASPYLSGLIFAAEDFAQDLSLTRTPSLTEFLYARSAIVTACRAHNLPSTIDLVCTSYKGEQGQRTLEEECIGGKGLGFNGKQCIHPTQVEICQRTFSPSAEESEWAVRLLVADEKADKQGRGAYTLDGKMIDAAVTGKARAILNRAELCGINIEEIWQKWAHQEPE
jgi:citrate lyase subunit beta-like protein